MKMPNVKNFYVKSSLFTILSLAAAACSYFLYPILIRILPSSEFGDFAVTTTMLNQILSIFLALNIISVHLVKKYGEEQSRHYIQIIQKILLWIFLGLCLIVFILAPQLQELLKINHLILFIPLGLILLVSIPVTIWNGFLQGHKELVRVGIFSFSASLAKLIFAALFGLLLGAVGALFGILVGTLLGILILQLYPGVRLPSIRSAFEKTSKVDLRFVSRLKFYIIQSVFVVGALGFLQGYDIALSKALFEPAIAGVYSGVSILSYVLYYVSFILIWIVLPEIDVNNPKNNRRVISTAYKIFGLITVASVGAELLLGEILLPLILGPEYSGKTLWLVYATLYQLMLVGIALYAFYLLIRHKSRSVLLVGYVLTCCLTLPSLLAHTPEEMILTLLLSTVFGVILYLITVGMINIQRLVRSKNYTATTDTTA